MVRWEPFQSQPSATDTSQLIRNYSHRETNSTIEFSRSLTFPPLASAQNDFGAIRQPQREMDKQEPTTVGDFEMEMSFVPDVLDPIISAFQAIAMDGGIDFDVMQNDEDNDDDDELPGVLLCPKSLQEAVCNVLDNAFRYSVLPKHNSVFTYNPSPRVRLRILPNQAPLDVGVTILVEDNGPGIRPTERNQVFERGFRSPSTKSIVEGTGIGLDISRALIKRMGGRLDVFNNGDVPDSLDGAVLRFILFRNPSGHL